MIESYLLGLNLFVLILICAFAYFVYASCTSTGTQHTAKPTIPKRSKYQFAPLTAPTTLVLTEELENGHRPDMSLSTERLSVQLSTLIHVFGRVQRGFALWWGQQSKQERQQFLLSCVPYMPLAHGKPCMYAAGEVVDMRGLESICPELNQKQLTEGDGLLKLLRKVTGVQQEDAFFALCQQNLPAAVHAVQSGQFATRVPRNEHVKGVVRRLPGEQFGVPRLVNVQDPKWQRKLAEGRYIRYSVWEALLRRLDVMSGSLAAFVDTYRIDVPKRRSYSAVGPLRGCAYCGALEPEEAGSTGTGWDRLEPCKGCRVVFYCRGKACQEADWQDHKPHCKPKELRPKKAAERAAERAARRTVGGSGGSEAAASGHKQD